MLSTASEKDRFAEDQDDGLAERRQRAMWLPRLAPWLLIGGLVLFHGLNNWIWLVDNVTLTGWDRPRHLETCGSLDVQDEVQDASDVHQYFRPVADDDVDDQHR